VFSYLNFGAICWQTKKLIILPHSLNEFMIVRTNKNCFPKVHILTDFQVGHPRCDEYKLKCTIKYIQLYFLCMTVFYIYFTLHFSLSDRSLKIDTDCVVWEVGNKFWHIILVNLVLQKFNNSIYLYLFSVSKYIIQVSEKYWQNNKIDGTQTHSRIMYTINERVYVCVCPCECGSHNTSECSTRLKIFQCMKDDYGTYHDE
jgi:hypothetical protein